VGPLVLGILSLVISPLLESALPFPHLLILFSYPYFPYTDLDWSGLAFVLSKAYVYQLSPANQNPALPSFPIARSRERGSPSFYNRAKTSPPTPLRIEVRHPKLGGLGWGRTGR
jgi:hypothetical protein